MNAAGLMLSIAQSASQTSSAVADLKMYARFGWGLRGFVRQRLTVPQAEAIVRERLEQREANFLRIVERGIFGYPRSPYIPLLRLAGCELGDLRQMLRDRGLDATLLVLREADVYVSFEEFKGRQPIVRQGRVIPAQPRDFTNPFLRAAYHSESGGSTGVGSRADIDLDLIAATAPERLLTYAAHGVERAPMALWSGLLPDARGMANLLHGVMLGNTPRRWFSTVTSRDQRPPLKFWLASYGIVALARSFGAPAPWPEPMPLERAEIVARWAAGMASARGACVVRVAVSMALRIAIAANEAGIDLSGVVLMGGGEPPTAAKAAVVAHSGARWVPMYAFAEVGPVAAGCANPSDANDLHFLDGTLALIQYSRAVPGFGLEVPAFHFTTLLPSAPKLLLNVESDDYGTIEPSTCGCPLERWGLRTHLRHIRRFRKLTGEGVTLIGGEMEHILESVLPQRFGGSPLDYQLHEEEDEQGFTRLSLLVSPRVHLSDEAEVIATVLAALERGSASAHAAGIVWKQARTLRVIHAEPIWTARGKLMPLHLSRRAASVSHTELSSPNPNE